MSEELTGHQRRLLEAIPSGKPLMFGRLPNYKYGFYIEGTTERINCRLSTVDALTTKGFLKAKGSILPSQWTITEEGRNSLTKAPRVEGVK